MLEELEGILGFSVVVGCEGECDEDEGGVTRQAEEKEGVVVVLVVGGWRRWGSVYT